MTNTPDSERDDKVRQRAYAIWEAEGRPAGRHEQHWHDAAREMEAEPAAAKPAPAAKAPRAARQTTKKAATIAAAPIETPAPAAKPARKPRTIKPKKD